MTAIIFVLRCAMRWSNKLSDERVVTTRWMDGMRDGVDDAFISSWMMMVVVEVGMRVIDFR